VIRGGRVNSALRMVAGATRRYRLNLIVIEHRKDCFCGANRFFAVKYFQLLCEYFSQDLAGDSTVYSLHWYHLSVFRHDFRMNAI
jgi:hypothetical protein